MPILWGIMPKKASTDTEIMHFDLVTPFDTGEENDEEKTATPRKKLARFARRRKKEHSYPKQRTIAWPVVIASTGAVALASALVVMMGAFSMLNHGVTIALSGSAENMNQSTQAGTAHTGEKKQHSTGTLNAADVQEILQSMLDPEAQDHVVAVGLEGGEAAVPTVREVGKVLDKYKLVYKWRVTDGSVVVSREIMKATLTLTLAGMGSKEQPVNFIREHGQWKLSNTSVCELAEMAQTTCTVSPS
ncbi:hypothetical protein P4N68_11915 [Corynebacterium felinum]|uniref:Low molecular weight antigen MTB12-like C-terminal domain-containing protein n=1 Tax=Corynebacterium felinum TaxID=131318 RepID=A0ABU2B9W0_9CORY|nr:hypothetical protein [Corynebacterium felinum]MDF5821774.1 hypothetical protein [Corynebacterium felinum]MDR7355419.1 hypothetical protein [Corynebacterium felinum]WJY94770.1 hypothetical protein CFELI_05720 [Corynebacterium felinum]